MSSSAHTLQRLLDSPEKTSARVDPELTAGDAGAPNPLWVITIAMAVFFGFTALLMMRG